MIYANGEIRLNNREGSSGVMSAKRIAKSIRKARLDSNVKAIVLRINSPGGSALASDLMYRETLLAKEEKPLIVSMGNLAASGGYYLACSAHKIYANHNTITGSIGVFGLFPVFNKFFENKLGIQFDGVSTNTHSDFMNGSSKLDVFEYEVVNASVAKIYTDFVGNVAQGRDMSRSQVNQIARGRVWTGIDAVDVGLVDEIGGLGDAIAYAAKMADLSEYKLYELPKSKDPLKQIFNQLKSEVSMSFIKMNIGSNYKYMEMYKNIEGMEGIQARLPFVIDIH